MINTVAIVDKTYSTCDYFKNFFFSPIAVIKIKSKDQHHDICHDKAYSKSEKITSEQR